MRSQICVVGGGPAGLAAALALTQSGREVTVLDRATPPIDKACGEGLLPDSLAALSRLGVPLDDIGAHLHGIQFFGDGTSVSANFANGIGRGVRRVRLHAALIQRAETLGIKLLWGVKNVTTQLGRVSFTGGHVDTELIVGADGQNSAVRQQAGLDAVSQEQRRFGFRKHYDVAPWSAYVEVHWGLHFQIYVTPVSTSEVGVALISSDPHLRLDAALSKIPRLARRLAGAPCVTPERGSLSVSRRLKRVHTNGYVLLGDASGSVDAITGEGLSLAFRQAGALVKALDADDMRIYERSHWRIGFKPSLMAALLLLLDRNPILQSTALRLLAAYPPVFESLLAVHAGNARQAYVKIGACG